MIALSRKAEKFIDRLDAKQYRQAARRIFDLGRDPEPRDKRHLSNNPGYSESMPANTE